MTDLHHSMAFLSKDNKIFESSDTSAYTIDNSETYKRITVKKTQKLFTVQTHLTLLVISLLVWLCG